MRCIECRFFDDEGDNELSISLRIKAAYNKEVIVCNGGLCRRLSPSPKLLYPDGNEPSYSWWPPVSDSDWCGEFQPKKKK